MKNVDEVIQCQLDNYRNQKINQSFNQINLLLSNQKHLSPDHSEVLSEKKLSTPFKYKRKFKFKLPQMKMKTQVPELLQKKKQTEIKKKRFQSNENLLMLSKKSHYMPQLKMKKLPKPKEQQQKFYQEKSEIEREFETPKYITIGKYNNYKYQSLHINYILREKQELGDKFTRRYTQNVFQKYKAQLALKKVYMRTKNMPFHLQSLQKRQSQSPSRSISRGSELRFELNEQTRKDLINKSKGEFTTKELQSINQFRTNPRNLRYDLSTINSSLIMSKFDNVWKKYKAHTMEDAFNSSSISLHKQEMKIHQYKKTLF